MQRIVLDMKGGLLTEAVVQVLMSDNPDFIVYRCPKPEETIRLCRACHANVLVMEVSVQPGWRLEERLQILEEIKKPGWDCKSLLMVDENEDVLQAVAVRQAVKDQLADHFVYASVSPAYLAGLIDTL